MSTEEFANLPRHVAIIMDGNGRWAKKRFLPRYAGHPAGVESVRQAVQLCTDLGIEVLTLFAFSSENWRRPQQEVGLLMELFIKVLDQEAEKLHRRNVRLKIIGDRSAFSSKLQDYITRSEALTKNNTGLQLIIAANYGGRWDIVQATQKLAVQVQKGLLNPQDITSEHLNQMTSLADVPEPDLFIRTGGEQRISNFLLWQLAYTEFYFTDTLWPDFKRDAFKLALSSFASRQRRFGQTGEQVEKSK
jgi:undecaprenyl diphosphate synthase